MEVSGEALAALLGAAGIVSAASMRAMSWLEERIRTRNGDFNDHDTTVQTRLTVLESRFGEHLKHSANVEGRMYEIDKKIDKIGRQIAVLEERSRPK